MRCLPPNWALCKIGDIASIIGGGTPSTSENSNFCSDGGIPWLTPADLSKFSGMYVSRGKRNLTKHGFQSCSARLLPKGAVLFSSRAPIGYVAIAGNDLCTNQGFRSLVCRQGILPEYVFFYLRHAGPLAEQLASGTTFAEISGSKMSEIPFRLPPTTEQRRIVTKLEELLGKVDACQKRLEKISVILKRFRQSVLAAACSGQMTEDWRKKNKTISAVSNALGAEKYSGEDLPETWRHVYVGGVITGLKYGTARKCSYAKKGVPVLRIPNIVKGVVDHSDLKYAEIPKSELNDLQLLPGDLLLIRSNGSVSLVGRVALVGRAENNFAYAGYLIRLRLNPLLVESRYLNLAFTLPSTRLQIEIPARSTSGVNNINSQEVRQLVIPLAPIPEQIEILRRVEVFFRLADQIEARYAAAKEKVDQLARSILAKAFRGELVPQDLKDEPVTALLEKIRGVQSRDGSKPSDRKRVLVQ